MKLLHIFVIQKIFPCTMKTNKPTSAFSESLSIFKNSVTDNCKEISTWLHDIFIVQDKNVIDDFAKTFRWHLKEILLCLVLVLLFAKVDKIQHFFTSFAIDIKEYKYSFGEFIWAFCSNGLVILWLSYVFWHKPKRLRGWIKKLTGDRRDRSYETHFNLPNGLWWVSVVATLPVVLVNVALSISLLKYYKSDTKSPEIPISKFVSDQSIVIFLAAVLLFVIISFLSKPRLRKNVSLPQLKQIFWKQFVIFLLSLLVYIVLFHYYHFYDKTPLRYIVLGGFIFIPTILLTHLWHAASKCLLKEDKIFKDNLEATGKRTSKKIDMYFDISRYVSYGLSICFFVMLNQKYFTTNEYFSIVAGPVAVLLFVFIFYYQLWDLFMHNVTIIRRNIIFVVLLFSVMFWGRREHFKLKYNGDTPGPSLQRTDMETFFVQWAYDRFQTDTLPSNTNPVFYLVAAEGGGSRSGAWTSSVLTELDFQSKGAFRRNCFAISSVSGGTIGSAVTLSLWDNAIRYGMTDSMYQSTSTGNQRSDRTDALYIQGIFGRNYISTAIAGIFFYDFWQSVPLINFFYTSNYSRTDRHQDEESDAVSKGLSKIIGKNANDFERYFKHTSFLRLNYQQSERASVPQPNVQLPLFFPNTTRVEDGRRGILSPVEMGGMSSSKYPPNPFIAAVDVIGVAAEENRFRSISISEAAGLSQLFPYVNSNVKVSDKAGRYMDGGAYENMGLTTICEIRKAISNVCLSGCEPRDTLRLKKIIQADDITLRNFDTYLSKAIFKFVLIYNTDNHGQEDTIESGAPRQWLDPLTALIKTPFSGHTDHIYHQVERVYGRYNKISNGLVSNDVVEFPLIDKSISHSLQEDIVMSRWLSKYEMKLILETSDSLVKEKYHELSFRKRPD